VPLSREINDMACDSGEDEEDDEEEDRLVTVPQQHPTTLTGCPLGDPPLPRPPNSVRTFLTLQRISISRSCGRSSNSER
jgi:hypothetical protein